MGKGNRSSNLLIAVLLGSDVRTYNEQGVMTTVTVKDVKAAELDKQRVLVGNYVM